MTNTVVRMYQNAGAFSDDAPRMARQGYRVVDSVQESREGRKVVVNYQTVTADAASSHAGVPPADATGDLVGLVILALVAAVLIMLVHTV